MLNIMQYDIMQYANKNENSVSWVKPAVETMLPIYSTISTVLGGEIPVKLARDKYLPDPSGAKCEPLEKERRYNRYLKNAIFVNYSRKTLYSLSGLAFQQQPVVNVPVELEPVLKNASGSGGQNLDGQAKEALEYVIAYGRCGILTDFPEGFAEGNPTLTLYAPWDIINFRVEDIGAEERLTLLVLREIHNISVGDYGEKEAVCYREFRLTEDGVRHILHMPSEQNGFVKVSDVKLLNNAGKPLTHIPFAFANSTGNETEKVEIPEFYDLVSLNLAHYRAFADYEEMCHLLGQQSLAISGLTDAWVEGRLKNGFEFGSREALLLPEGGEAKVISANANGLNVENLNKIEAELLKIGARIAEKKTVRTATEAEIENISETSALISAARSVSAAYTQALKFACEFAGLSGEDVSYDISTNYDLTTFTISDAQNIGHMYALGALTMQELREALLKIGLASASYTDFLKEKEKDIDADDIFDAVFKEAEEEAEEEAE